MAEYADIDEKITQAVRDGKKTFADIQRRVGDVDFRVVDRRLQALRKRGALAYVRKTGWSVVDG